MQWQQNHLVLFIQDMWLSFHYTLHFDLKLEMPRNVNVNIGINRRKRRTESIFHIYMCVCVCLLEIVTRKSIWLHCGEHKTGNTEPAQAEEDSE